MDVTTTKIVVGGKMYKGVVTAECQFDSKTESLLYGDELENDMLVILEPRWRENITLGAPEEIITKNRWCTVTCLRVDEDVVDAVDEKDVPTRFSFVDLKHTPTDESIVEKSKKIKKVVVRHINFIGVYADGHKATRCVVPTSGWYVKKHSIRKNSKTPRT